MVANGCGGVSRRSDSRVSRAKSAWVALTNLAGGGSLCSSSYSFVPPAGHGSRVQMKRTAKRMAIGGDLVTVVRDRGLGFQRHKVS